MTRKVWGLSLIGALALSVGCADGNRAAEALSELTRAGVQVADFSLGQPSLDEVFLALTGRPAEDEDKEGQPA